MQTRKQLKLYKQKCVFKFRANSIQNKINKVSQLIEKRTKTR